MARTKSETTSSDVKKIVIKPLDIITLRIGVIGTAPLLMHAFSQKAKQEMLDKQMGKTKSRKRPPKDPRDDYDNSIYRLPDGSPGFPVLAFKSGMIDACRYVDGITMVAAKGYCRIRSTITGSMLAPIFGEPEPHEQHVRLPKGGSDLRYRALFPEWSSEFLLSVNIGATTVEQALQLLQIAGYSIGIGDWRPGSPESSGEHGTYEIRSAAEEK